MPALDTMMRLQAGYNGQEMEGINQLSQTLGGIIQGGGQRDYRRAAINFFKDGNISPERIQEFTSMYPGVDPVETFQIAGAVAKQREAQDMKDAGKMVMGLFGTVPVEDMTDPQKLMGHIKKLGLKPGVEEKLAQNFPKLVEFSQGILKERKERAKGEPIGAHGNIDVDPNTGLPRRDDKGNPIVIGAPTEEPNEWMTSPDGKQSIPFTKKAAQLLATQGWKKYQAPAQEKPHEVNVQGDVDTFLGMKYPGYYTDKAKRTEILDKFATDPNLKAEYEKWWDKRKTTAPPINVIVPGYQDKEGNPVKTNLREPGIKAPPGGLQKTPSEGDIKEARNVSTMTAIMDELDRAFAAAEKDLPQGATGRVLGYPGRVAGIATQSSPELAYANNLADGFLAKFARAAGEVGVLTEQDVGRAKSLAYSVHDTNEVRKLKREGLMGLYQEIYERGKRQTAPLGKNPAGGGANPPPSIERKVIGGKNYIKQNGKWFEVQ